MVREPVERHAQDDTPRARRPAERLLRLAHPLSRADHPPQHDTGGRTYRGDRVFEAALGGNLRFRRIAGRRGDARGPANRRRVLAHRRLTSPRAFNHPSGDSARFTLTFIPLSQISNLLLPSGIICRRE
jgi:hypothetical protein